MTSSLLFEQNRFSDFGDFRAGPAGGVGPARVTINIGTRCRFFKQQ
jgi:hypothetical protein